MKTLLVPLDGSLTAEQVLPYVRLLAPILGARIHLLRVIPETRHQSTLLDSIIEPRGRPGDAGSVLDAVAVQQQYAESYLESHAVMFQSWGLDVSTETQIGRPAETIVEVADRIQATLIVIATHGYSGLRRWTLGSVTDKVMQITTTPVFVVRSTEQRLFKEYTLKRIMLPLDGSEFGRQAIPIASDLAVNAWAELMPITVVAPSSEAAATSHLSTRLDEALPVLRERLMQELGTTADQCKQHEVPVSPLAVVGVPAEALVDEAIKHHADVIVMATHGYSGYRRWALGSVADKVLHATPIPLLLVHGQPTHHAAVARPIVD